MQVVCGIVCMQFAKHHGRSYSFTHMYHNKVEVHSSTCTTINLCEGKQPGIQNGNEASELGTYSLVITRHDDDGTESTRLT